MKIGITGHTSGIGLALFDHLKKNHEVYGYSRSNGYALPESIERITSKSKDFDVFINNAFNYVDGKYDYSQIDLLTKLAGQWKSEFQKTIINISSRSPDYNMQASYDVMKRQLDETSKQFSLDNTIQCKIINLKPGCVDTESQRKVIKPKLKVENVISIVDFCLSLPPDINVYSLSFQKH